MTDNRDRTPPVWLSLVPLSLIVALIGCVVAVFGDDSLSGASQVALILGSACCVGIAMACGYLRFQDFEKAVTDKIASVSQAIVILLLIGALGGAWMVSGVVPTLIYYGMEVLHPQWFLPSTCLICAGVSLMTGSSWTTVATIGIALMGIGTALGFPEGWVAGAILSGAYFGDKISPLSDTTVMASSTVGTPLFQHIRYMLRTTLPTYGITLIIFTVASLLIGASGHNTTGQVRMALAHTFTLSPWLMLVPILTCLLIAKRLPSLVILFISVVMAAVAALWMQMPLLHTISGDESQGVASAFRGLMQMMYGSTSLDTGVPSLNSLVATRGMAGMMSTIWLIICAMIFGAAMSASRMLDSIMGAILRLARNLITLVSTTAAAGILLNLTTSDQYLSIILTSSLYRDTYQRMGLQPRLLSRTIEDSATVTSVLIPWNTCGMTQSSVLGVSTLAYAPYCFFCYLSPVVTIIASYFVQRSMRQKVNETTIPEFEGK